MFWVLQVVGSNPAAPTNPFNSLDLKLDRPVSGWEHRRHLPVFSRETSSDEEAVVSKRAAKTGRFLIRMGGIGWMVYDRDRRGPALMGADVAANLTKEQAEWAYRILAGSAADPEDPPA